MENEIVQSLQETTERNPKKEIGDKNVGTEMFVGDMTSEKQKVLQNLYEEIGNCTITLKNLKGGPPCITDKAIKEEQDNNWIYAYK